MAAAARYGAPMQSLRQAPAGVLRRLSTIAYVRQAGKAGRTLGAQGLRRRDELMEMQSRFALSIHTVLYVGANVGQELDLLAFAFPDATIHCFEPQRQCQDGLVAATSRWPGRAHVHPIALSDRAGDVTLHRPVSHDQASSLLEPSDEMHRQFPHVTGWGDETVAAEPLDEWAARNPLENDIVIKMDVQGAEQLVIAGGSNVFAQARMVITEIAAVTTYSGAPDMHATFDTMAGLGFGYAGEMGQVRSGDGSVVEFDGVFARSRAGQAPP